MKELSLRPYPGRVFLCRSMAELRREHRRLTKNDIGESSENSHGLMAVVKNEKTGKRIYLVTADTPSCLAHEFSHVIFSLFDYVGMDPRDSQGEAFCYLLDRLLQDAGVK